MIRPTLCASVLLMLLAIYSTRAEEASTQPSAPAATQPDPALTPSDVVKAQLTAMQHNNEPTPDAGLATVFDFASPGNREKTGPLDHFIKIVKAPAYAPMFTFVKAEYAPVKADANRAQQFVRLTDAQGNKFIYVFLLSKQADGQYKDCWMTDGVVPAGNQPAAPAAPAPSGDQPVKT